MSAPSPKRRLLLLSAVLATLAAAAVAWFGLRPPPPTPPLPLEDAPAGPATDAQPAPAPAAATGADDAPRADTPGAPPVVPRGPLRLSGTVVAPDGRPVAGARVVAAWRDDRLGGPARETARTGDDGAFALALRDGPEPVRVQAFGDGFAPSAALSLLAEGAEEPLTLRLRAGGTLALRAVAADGGGPLARAEVRVRALDGAPGGRPVATDADGRAAVGPLGAGRYAVRVLAPGRLPALRDDVAVTGDAVTDLGDVALAAGAFVSGSVIDETSGAPVAAVHVRALVERPAGTAPTDDGDANALPRARSDPRGHFRLGPLPSEVTALRLVKPGFEPRVVALATPPADDQALGSVPLRPRPDGGIPEDEAPAGPGLGLRLRDGVARVAAVAPGSSAEAAGLRPGDRVLSVAGYPLEDVSPRDAAALLAGPARSDVAVEVTPPGGAASRTVVLHRR